MFQMIELRFVDIHGRLKAMNLPLDKPAATIEDVKKDTIFENGANIDGSSVEGFTPIENSDLSLIPLPETLFQRGIGPIVDNCNVVLLLKSPTRSPRRGRLRLGPVRIRNGPAMWLWRPLCRPLAGVPEVVRTGARCSS